MGTDRPGLPEADELRAELAHLTARVYALERRLAAPQASRAPAPPPPPRGAAPPAPEITPLTPQFPAASSTDSLEARLGIRWFSYLGLIALVLGVAVLLKLAIDNDWIGLSERVVAGIGLGIVLIATSERWLRREFTSPAYALNAAGAALIYLALWAGALLYGILPFGLAFAGMALVTAYEGWCSWAKNNPVFAALALLAGFLIPVVLANGQNREGSLFTYLLILDAGIALLAAFKPWSWLIPVALGASLLLGTGWHGAHFTADAWSETALFTAAFIALFSLAVRGAHGMRVPHSVADRLLALALPVVIVVFGLPALISIEGAHSAWHAWTAALLAAFSFGLFRLSADPDRPSQGLWQTTHLLLAIALAALAIEFQFDSLTGRTLLAAWLVEGLAVLWLCRRLPRQRLARAFALALLMLGALVAIVANAYAGTAVIFNPRFAMFVLAFAAAAAGALIARQAPAEPGESLWLDWPRVAAILGLLAGLLPLIAGLSEIHTAWWGAGYGPNFSAAFSLAHLHALQFGSQLSYSIWAMLYGALLLAAGFWKRWAPLRWLALSVLVFAIAKVLVFDVSNLAAAYRVVSLLLLGALLLAISYAYQRDWLKPFMQPQSSGSRPTL